MLKIEILKMMPMIMIAHRPGGLQLPSLRRNRILVSRGRRKPYSLAVAISATPVAAHAGGAK